LLVHTEKKVASKHHVQLIIVSEMLFFGLNMKKSHMLCAIAPVLLVLSPDYMLLGSSFDFERNCCDPRFF
jgi:hypothetical protein